MTPTVDKTFSYKRQFGYETIGVVAFTTPLCCSIIESGQLCDR